MKANTHRAARTRSDNLGVPGVVCSACYATLRYRATHGLDPIAGRVS